MKKRTNREVLENIEAILEKMANPESGSVHFGGSYVHPAPGKIYDTAVRRWGGPDKFAQAIKERSAGGVPGLIGAWDKDPEAIEFKKDFPYLF
jgi:hypothetical protein